MPASYDFNAMRLAKAGFNPQMSHLGMIEFHLDNLVAGAKDVLMIGLKSVRMPEPRTIQELTINYLNGVIKYPGRPTAIGNLSCSFQDYIDGKQRLTLHQWMDKIYDERTGIGGLPSRVKTNAHFVMFGQNGTTSSTYYLQGIWPKKDPAVPALDFSSGAEVTIDIDMSVDFMLEELMGGINFSTSAGTTGQKIASQLLQATLNVAAIDV